MVGVDSEILNADYVVDADIFDHPNSSYRVRVNDSGNSLLGVIVDRSSFDDDDDELTTYGGGRDAISVIDENHPSSSSIPAIHLPDHHTQQLQNQQQHLIDMNIPGGGGGGSGGVVMRNGKIRRKMRWKPRFGKKKSDGGWDSNASVVSALTNRSNSTSRSSSTTRSFLSHFSKRSNTSFHTFHSTETPVATNKANRPQAPHTVMRPNYQDSFDHSTSNNNSTSINIERATIETEGKHAMHNKRESFRSSLDSVQEISVLHDLHDVENDSEPPKSFTGITSSTSFSMKKSTSNNHASEAGKISENKSYIKSQQQQQQMKTRRPPLFKRRMRHFKNSNSNSTSRMNSSNKMNTDKTCSSPSDTNSTSTSSSSISPSLSLERENSLIPVSLGDEYEDNCRVLFNTTDHSTINTGTSTAERGSSSSRKSRDIVTVTTTTRSSTNEEKKCKEVTTSEFVGSVSSGGDTSSNDVISEEGIEESSVSTSLQHAGDNQSIHSGSVKGVGAGNGQSSVHCASSNAVGSVNSAPTILQRRISSITKKRSSSPAIISTASSKHGVSTKGGGNDCIRNNSNISNLILKEKKNQSRPMLPPPNNPDKAEHNLRAINEMAAEHMAHGEYEEAADVFEEILRGQQERYGQDHYRVGTALHNYGIVNLKMGDFNKAIEICQRAVAVRKESLVPNHPDVAVSLAQLGVAHLESHNFNKALAAFRDALHIRRNFLGPRHPKCSKILNNIGCALYSLNDFGASKHAFDEALDIQRVALRNIPLTESTESTQLQSNALLLSMASTLCNIGSIKVRRNEFEEAILDLEEALLIQQSVLGDTHPTVLSTSDSIGLVDSAKNGPSNNESSNSHKFYINKAVAVCSDVDTNPSTVVTELFGIENLDSISSSISWFQNPCGPGKDETVSF